MSFDPLQELQSQIAKRTAGCKHHPAFTKGCSTPLEGDQWEALIQHCTPDARWSHERWLCLNDLYYLMVHIFGIRMLKTQWHLDRIREVETVCDDVIDLWSRGTGKSAVKTFGKVIQEILRNPDITIGIFSHTRPIAKDFLKKIKTTFEGHEKLRNLFPDILYDRPESQSPCWSIERGLVVKRESVTRGESSVEAWGLVDGQPTALALDTPIMTTKGFKLHGDLQIGDYVFGSDGKPTMVMFNTGPMLDKECYRVVLDDTEIVAASDHLWPIDRAISPRNRLTKKQDTGWDVTEREIVKTIDLPLSLGPNRQRRKRLLRTPVLDLPLINLPLDPYVLGLWLGDGSSDTGIITSQDEEVLQQIVNADFVYTVAQDRGSYKMYRVTGLRERLKAMGLLWNKHIPTKYLQSHELQRLALLQGLMDSDGACHSNGWGQCIFTNTNLGLIRGVYFLAASLGFKPSRVKNDWDGNPKHNRRYTVQFLGIKSTKPFRLTRKLARCRDERCNDGRYVRKLVKIDSVPVNCIQVAAADGIYLVGESLVPTHNSKHFDILCYDDIQKEQITDYMIDQIEQAFDTSLGLGATKPPRWWMCGVFFRGGSIYENMVDRKVGLVRIRPAINDDGTSPIWTDEQVRATIKNLKPGTVACEYLMNPTLKGMGEGFQAEWLRYHDGFTPEQLNSANIYIVVDPGKGKERGGRSGKTSIQVIAFMPDKKRYLIDGIKAAMDLEQRTSWVFSFHRQYNGNDRIIAVGYEQYGLQADVDHIRLEQQREGYTFEIVPLSAHLAKDDRIEMLIPIFRSGEMVIPKFVPKRIVGGIETDFLRDFVNDEYSRWPATKIKDALDCMSWITYVKEDGDNRWKCQFPESYDDPSVRRKELDWDESGGFGGSWMCN